MIPIKRGEPPQELVERQKEAESQHLPPDAAYDTLRNPLKEQVRKQLVKEQGGLCAYCMCRIPEVESEISTHINIEHYIPRNPEDKRDVGQGLDYYNFLAVCYGNEKGHKAKIRRKDLTCDAHRGNTEFKKINPFDHETLKSIYYNMDGSISATDPEVLYDLDTVLNLNSKTAPKLAQRREALNALIDDIGNISDNEKLLDYCQTRLQDFLDEDGQKTPYVGILTWLLQRLIDGLEST